jgi:hypothetical protein
MLHHATGMPILDARDDFRRARRSQLAARLLRALSFRRQGGVPHAFEGAPQGAAKLEVIPLRDVVGTVEPTISFDARFRPASEHVRARWERVALAHRRGRSLPPIAVVRGDDGYYVTDGRHRVSVALALGLRDIDAWVTQAAPAPAPVAAPAPARARRGGAPVPAC